MNIDVSFKNGKLITVGDDNRHLSNKKLFEVRNITKLRHKDNDNLYHNNGQCIAKLFHL
jgi:hypothetical protein